MGRFYLFSRATGVRFGAIWDFPKGGDRLRMWILVIFNTFFSSLEGKDTGTPKPTTKPSILLPNPQNKQQTETGIGRRAFYICI